MATTGGGPEPTWNAVRTPAASSSAASPASVSPIPELGLCDQRPGEEGQRGRDRLRHRHGAAGDFGHAPQTTGGHVDDGGLEHEH